MSHGNPTRRRARHLRFAIRALIVPLVGIAVLAIGSGEAFAYSASDRSTQTAYARETMNMTYTTFLARKADFAKARCVPATYTFTGGKSPASCTKPSPYDAFDWTDDGCSGAEAFWGLGRGPSNIYRNLFNEPCQQHDFGYRNFGKNLQLSRTEDTRAWIDGRLLTEMNRLCDSRFSGVQKAGCRTEALGVYGAVRVASSWRPATAPVKQLPPPLQFSTSASNR